MNLRGSALLDSIRYLPSIRSRQAELRGYDMLRAETKERLHPIVSLGRYGRSDQANRVLEFVSEKAGPCFLDLNIVPNQACADFERLFDPTNNFEAWRAFALQAENIIPVAILREDASERPFIRQVLEIERSFGAVVIRSRQPTADLGALQAALSAVDEVNNVLIVLDFAYIRDAMDPKLTEARRVISALRMTDDTARVVVMSSSFPRAVSVYGDQGATLEILERSFHSQLGGDQVAIYGDHASIYPDPFDPSPSRFVPRIDYCADYLWSYRRRRDEQGGYVECAHQITALADWEPLFAEQSWGAGVISETDRTSAVPAGFGAPANWIAARVNMHIERQAALSFSDEGLIDLDDDF